MAVVSIIIPLYNKAGYIRRALESVFAQTHRDYELLVVNDGSTDDGPLIVERYRDPRLRVIHQQNGGPGAARNRGIGEAAAPYVAFLDADDEWLPEFLNAAMTRLAETNDYRVFVSNHLCGKGDATFLHHYPQLALPTGPTRLPADLEPRAVKTYVDLFHSGAVVAAKSVLERHGGFVANRCTYGEDAFLWLRVLLTESFFFEREPLMRMHLDASELGHGRKTPYPVHPIVMAPQAILECCPGGYRRLLERTLDYYALVSLWRCLHYGDVASAREILRRFPYTRCFRVPFVKARIRVCLFRCTKLLGLS